MDRVSWAPILQLIIGAVAAALFFKWIERSRNHKQPESVNGELAFPTPLLLVNVVLTIFWFWLVIHFSGEVKSGTSPRWAIHVFVWLGGISALQLANYLRNHSQVSSKGLSYDRLFQKSGFFEWSDVRRIKYSRPWNRFTVELNTGVEVHLSTMLTGLPKFAQVALLNVKHELIDVSALQMLRKVEQEKLRNHNSRAS